MKELEQLTKEWNSASFISELPTDWDNRFDKLNDHDAWVLLKSMKLKSGAKNTMDIHSGLSQRKHGRALRVSFKPAIWDQLIDVWGDPRLVLIRLKYEIVPPSQDDLDNNERRLIFSLAATGQRLVIERTPGPHDNFFGTYISIGRALPWLPNIRGAQIRLVSWENKRLELVYPCIIKPEAEPEVVPVAIAPAKPIKIAPAKPIKIAPVKVTPTNMVQFTMTHPVWGEKVWQVSDIVAQQIAMLLNEEET